jgi:hypothetical protein
MSPEPSGATAVNVADRLNVLAKMNLPTGAGFQ